jgi:hypothetical protein
MIARTLLTVGALLLGLAPALAQTARTPQAPEPPPSLDRIEQMEKSVRNRRDFYLKPETEAAARSSDAKMESMQRRMDARVRRVTRSICEGCTTGSIRRHADAVPRDEPLPDDPAQAPVE